MEVYHCNCGVPNRPNVPARVIGGQYTLPNEYPWQAALVKNNKHIPFCGGSLVSTRFVRFPTYKKSSCFKFFKPVLQLIPLSFQRHVLTASHCTVEIEIPEDLNVLLGEHDLTTSYDRAIRYTVSRIIEHPGYNPETISNDYTIIILTEKVIIFFL